MTSLAVSFLSGILFAFGLGASSMTDANQVLAFLNLSGDWNYALGVTMTVAFAITLPVFSLARQRKGLKTSESVQFEPKRAVDHRLIVGALLFGLGWGLGGLCPGPALVSAMSGDLKIMVFVIFMSIGMLGHDRWEARRFLKKQTRQLMTSSRPRFSSLKDKSYDC